MAPENEGQASRIWVIGAHKAQVNLSIFFLKISHVGIFSKGHMVGEQELRRRAVQGNLRDLIKKCKAMLDEGNPDGANLGWNIDPVGGQNVNHAHLHLFGRFADEPLATKGLRYAFKQPSNKRGSAKE